MNDFFVILHNVTFVSITNIKLNFLVIISNGYNQSYCSEPIKHRFTFDAFAISAGIQPSAIPAGINLWRIKLRALVSPGCEFN